MYHFILSSYLFHGYKIQLNEIYSIDEICMYMKRDLIYHLDKLNLINLIEEAKKLDLHIHNYDFNYIKNNPQYHYYICECNH